MIHVFYRHYNVQGSEEWRPKWFDYEKCLINFLNTIESNDNIFFTVIYDGDDSENFIFKYNLNLIRISAKSDNESFRQTLEIIKNSNINENDIVYLLENDYLHTPNWDSKVIEFFNSNDDAYLSLYDHGDKYMSGYDNLRSKIIVTNSCHFRTTPSTCGSFLCRMKTLIDDIKFHQEVPNFLYNITKTPVDHGKFLMLNFLKERSIYSSIPGLSTHCLNGLLSPTIKWENII